jgi:hypothetical protein
VDVVSRTVKVSPPLSNRITLYIGKERKERKERKESAAADLQQASVNAGAGLPTGQEMALIFRCQGTYKQRQQRQEKDGGNFQEGHGQEAVGSAGDRSGAVE